MGEKLNKLLGMVGGQLLGPAFGIAMEGHNDRRQREQQAALQRMQMEGNKEMIKFQNEQAMEMWRNTNYGPQVEEMKKAGLNPALLYGMSGGGGATASSASGNVTSGNAQGVSNEAMQGMGMQLGMMDAQRKLIEAQTENVKTDTIKKGGVDTKKVETEIANLTQGITNQQTIERLNRIQGNISQIEEEIKMETKDVTIRRIGWETDKILEELDILKNESDISEETWKDKVQIVKTELTAMGLKNELMKSDKALNEAQIKKIAADINQKWAELSISESKNYMEHEDRIKAIEEYTKNALKVAGIMAASHVVGDVMSIVTRKTPKGMIRTREKEGNTTFEETIYK